MSDPQVASAAMDWLLSGDAERDITEVRAHLAAVQEALPPFIQGPIIAKFGGLNAAEFDARPEPPITGNDSSEHRT